MRGWGCKGCLRQCSRVRDDSRQHGRHIPRAPHPRMEEPGRPLGGTVREEVPDVEHSNRHRPQVFRSVVDIGTSRDGREQVVRGLDPAKQLRNPRLNGFQIAAGRADRADAARGLGLREAAVERFSVGERLELRLADEEEGGEPCSRPQTEERAVSFGVAPIRLARHARSAPRSGAESG